MAVCAAFATLGVAPATAEFGISNFTSSVTNEDGSPDIQAGSHPYEMTTTIELNTRVDPNTGLVTPDENPKDIEVALPPGLVGNPTATPMCTLAQLSSKDCPDSSAIGTVDVNLVPFGLTGPIPVYNVEPPEGTPARFAFTILTAVVTIDARVRTGEDYGVSVTIANMPETFTMSSSSLTLWGVPADSSHDPLRGKCAANALNEFEPEATSCHSEAPSKPFLTLPTDCSVGPMAMTARVDSWLHPGEWKVADFSTQLEDGTPFGVDGCYKLGFNPSIDVSPQVTAAETPTGMSVALSVPQDEIPGSLATANLKKSVTALPLGVRINPSAADGLTGCSPQQIALGDGSAPTCADSSKIGTVKIDSTLLPTPLTGSIFQAKQNDNPFGSTLSFYTYAKGSGVVVKLAAKVHADPLTGQVTTTFNNDPQLAFSKFSLLFFGGSRAPLMTPPTCGTFTATEEASPWSASDPQNPTPAEVVGSSDSFQISSGPGGSACADTSAARPHAPKFSAGSVIPLAGAFSPFVLRVSREDGSQELKGLEATLPPGLLGKLAGIPYCPEASLAAAAGKTGAAEQASPSCPAASRLGSVDVAAGAGALPFHVPGSAYLTGPYKGAPLGLAFVTPAVAGPLDLGTVVVRTALRVDPVTARITAVSDPIPHILDAGGDGFPLDVRSIAVTMDRDQFTLNPTSCNPMSVDATVTGAGGDLASAADDTGAALSDRFQVGACAALGFKPKLRIRLEGETKRGGHPRLRATLTMPQGGANIARAAVSLPRSEFLDQGHIGTVCTRVQFAAEECPAGSVYGRARAFTPLLDRPLEGPVYLRSSDHELPDLVADLGGQISVELSGRIDTTRGRGIRTTFDLVPDAAVSKFVLEMRGGEKGLLENSRNLCSRRSRVVARFDAHNGRIADLRPRLANDCGGKARKHARPKR